MFVSFCNNALDAGSLVAVTLAAVLIAASLAVGGPLSIDENAMSDWQGTKAFSGSGAGLGFPPFFSADVDYAVYAPGQFQLSFPGLSFPGYDPSGGSDYYVYAYQIFHTGPASDDSLSQFTVGLDGDEILGGSSYVAGTGIAPNSLSLTDTSSVWNYPGNPIPPGEPDPSSAVLIFTSANFPELDTSTLSGPVATVDTQLLPSPSSVVPEPGTVTMIFVASVTLLGYFRLVRRRSIWYTPSNGS